MGAASCLVAGEVDTVELLEGRDKGLVLHELKLQAQALARAKGASAPEVVEVGAQTHTRTHAHAITPTPSALRPPPPCGAIASLDATWQSHAKVCISSLSRRAQRPRCESPARASPGRLA